MPVEIKSPKEIDAPDDRRRRRRSSAGGRTIPPGVTTEDINRFVHEDTLRRGRPARSATMAFEEAWSPFATASVPSAWRMATSSTSMSHPSTKASTATRAHVLRRAAVGWASTSREARKSLEIGIGQVRDGASSAASAAIGVRREPRVLGGANFVSAVSGRRFHEAPPVYRACRPPAARGCATIGR
jgi:methionyl aminopeptidase